MFMFDKELRNLNESWRQMCEVQTEIDHLVIQYIRKIESATDFQKSQYMEVMIQQATDKIANKFQLDEASIKELKNRIRSLAMNSGNV